MDTEQSTEPTLNDYDADFLRELYCALLLPRMVEEKMLLLLRQGRISKWFSGIGQEAISVGATAALEFEDYVLPIWVCSQVAVFLLTVCLSSFKGKQAALLRGVIDPFTLVLRSITL